MRRKAHPFLERGGSVNNNKKSSTSYGLPLGLCLGVSIGTAIGAATNNMGLWMALGPAFGLLFGLVIGHRNASGEEKNGEGDDDMTDKENKEE